jgi:crotonobetainyl-CoA:carnitine CoA-transferase CaiB-like acyl-CoA transferase
LEKIVTEQLNEFMRSKRALTEKSNLPLKDIRVLDLGTVVAAPFAATFLGDFGAEVIKVENPGMPDAIRGWAAHGETQPWWFVISRNKYPVTLNLKAPEGAKIFESLIKDSDVLLENFRAGVLDRLGFTTERLYEINPGLVIGRISGYGQTGPYSNRPGFGTLAEGFSGFTFLNSEPGAAPENPPMPLADMTAGIHLAFATMVALRGAKRGEYGGKEIEVSLYEPLLGMLGSIFLEYWLTGKIPQPFGSQSSFTVPRNNYQTKDGRWLSLSASAQVPFERLMDGIGKPEWKTDPRFKTNQARSKPENRKELNQAIAAWFATMNIDEALTVCEAKDLTVGKINDMHDIAEDRHVIERKSLIDIKEPVSGKALRFPDVAMRIKNVSDGIRFPGLPMGAANEVIYGDLLGYTAQEIEMLREKKAI